ncbi:MAG: hypothetical protein HKO98_07715 [Gemmatimonadetes bacterium]|nr:hypothetical protein [Gemmatimonadota bacterium]
MNRFRAPLALVLVTGLVACSDDGGGTVPDPTIDRIEVTPDGSSVTEVGTSVQFAAEAFTTDGLPFAGVTFSWSSSDPSVGTIDDTGLATSVGFGETTITVSASGVSAQAVFSVRDCSEALTLAEGEWVATAVPGDEECGIILPAGAAGDRYRVGLVRTSPADSFDFDRPEVSVEVVPLGAANASAALFPAGVEVPLAAQAVQESRRLPAVPQLSEAAARAESTARLHQRLHAQAIELAERLGPENVIRPGPLLTSGPLAQDLPGSIQVYTGFERDCQAAGDLDTATLIWQNDQVAFYQDEDERATGNAPTAAQVQRMADFARDYGFPVIDEYFGGVPDNDGNGKVIVVVTPSVGNFAAFVWSGDYFTAASCPGSNEGEYVYFSSSLILDQDEGQWQSLETLVHEFKHNSSMYNSVNRPGNVQQPYHPAWEEEGSAEIAGNMASRVAWAAVGGPAPNETVVSQDIYDHGFSQPQAQGDIRPEFYGVLLRLFRTHAYLTSQPNGLFTTPLGAGSGHSIYGTGWTFLRWLGDAYGGASGAPLADADIFRAMNASATLPGVAGMENVVGTAFRELMEEYAAAVMRNGTPLAAGPKAFTSYDFVSAIEDLCFAADNPPCQGLAPGPTGAWPWPVTMNTDGTPWRGLQDAATYSGRIGGGGIRVHDLVSNGTGTGAEIRVTGAPAGTRVVVLRID